MNTVLAGFVLWFCAVPSATVSGHVASQDGSALSGARVFLEPGVGGALLEAPVDSHGQFTFDSAPSGLCGLFAIADGKAWGGVSRTFNATDTVSDLNVVLKPAGDIGGKVVEGKNAAISGAHVTRVLLLDGDKVGIPFAKLAAFGFPEPVSGPDGRFTVSRLPSGGKVALKIAHPAYAQAAITDIAVGNHDVKVTVSPGILVQGTVQSRDGSVAVSNAAVLIQRLTPPNDTAVATSDMLGEFRIRLDPGYYAYQAAGAQLRSAGWQKLMVTGQQSTQSVSLRVSAITRLTGEVKDAVSGSPVPGARVTLMTYGNPSATVTTGINGTYELVGIEGENVVTIEPAPGYQRPERPIVTFQAKGGEPVELPTYWLTRLPSYRLNVVDAAGKPVAGALVRLIRPAQIGWQVTDAQGQIDLGIAADPPGGKLVGLVEHPTQPEGAVFALTPRDAPGARVQLLELATVSGSVCGADDKGIEGAVVGALFQNDNDSEPLPLWRTITDAKGNFAWPCVAPFVPSVCLARVLPNAFGRSTPFNADAGGHVELTPIKITAAEPSKIRSVFGKRLTWYENKLLGGSLPSQSDRAAKPGLIVYCGVDNASATIEALSAAQKAIGDVVVAVVVDGDFHPTDPAIPILQGHSPDSATAFVIDRSGVVVLESVGLPPAVAIQRARNHAEN